MANKQKRLHPDVWRTEAALALCERFNRLIPDESYTLGEALTDIDAILAKAPLPAASEQASQPQVQEGCKPAPVIQEKLKLNKYKIASVALIAWGAALCVIPPKPIQSECFVIGLICGIYAASWWQREPKVTGCEQQAPCSPE